MDIFEVIKSYGFRFEDNYFVDDYENLEEQTEWEVYGHPDEPITIHIKSKYQYWIFTEGGQCDIETLTDYWLKGRASN